jgi:hypothetical protein
LPKGAVDQPWDRIETLISPPSCKKGEVAKAAEVSNVLWLAVINAGLKTVVNEPR